MHNLLAVLGGIVVLVWLGSCVGRVIRSMGASKVRKEEAGKIIRKALKEIAEEADEYNKRRK